jgi:hypothetical protein
MYCDQKIAAIFTCHDLKTVFDYVITEFSPTFFVLTGPTSHTTYIQRFSIALYPLVWLVHTRYDFGGLFILAIIQ